MGYRNSRKFHVFELTKQIPTFFMYTMPHSLTESPKSIGQINKLSKNFKPSEHYVSFELKERIQRMCMWVNQVGNLVLRQKSKSYFQTSHTEFPITM